ncbi:hypothetical protein Q0601_00855 [Paracoccus onubensis]|uniref:hypothetical protein n=1 Tax=Paracoccus onubensis TaxID=1675788 RepID=UPI002730BB65|nr:hypothetical protein [Paracoccus onubensis]MDP0925711.1 hypothetical protein [Paracoccus onubensis]
MTDKKQAIDWPSIKSDWVKSDWSIRKIAEWYQVSESAIRKRSKAESWPERTQPAANSVRTDTAPRREPVMMAGVDATKPENIVSRGQNLIFRLLDELDAVTTHNTELAEMIETHEEDPRRRAAMMKAIELPGRANVVKALATAFKTWSESAAPEGKKAQRQASAEARVGAGGRGSPGAAPKLAVDNTNR